MIRPDTQSELTRRMRAISEARAISTDPPRGPHAPSNLHVDSDAAALRRFAREIHRRPRGYR